MKAIHRKDAILLLETGEPCDLKVWKLSDGEILTYKQVRCIGSHWRGGTHNIVLPNSGVIRKMRDITLFEINGMTVFL